MELSAQDAFKNSFSVENKYVNEDFFLFLHIYRESQEKGERQDHQDQLVMQTTNIFFSF